MSSFDEANRTYHVAQGSMALLPNYYRWTYGVFRPFLHGDVVELGSGSGLGLSAYVDRADTVVAVDHDAACLGEIARRWPSSKVRTLEADLAGDWHELDGVTADAVMMMDVVEHFADDRALLEKAVRLLKPGGLLMIKVPAQRDLYSEMDKASGHFRRYDEADLVGLAGKLGLETVKLAPINRVGALAYRARKTQKSNFSRSFSPGQLRAINLALPIIRMGDLVPGLPGLSLVAIFRRP